MITRKNIIVTYNINFLEGVLKTPSGGAENPLRGCRKPQHWDPMFGCQYFSHRLIYDPEIMSHYAKYSFTLIYTQPKILRIISSFIFNFFS